MFTVTKNWILKSVTLARLLWIGFSNNCFPFCQSLQKRKSSDLRERKVSKNCFFAKNYAFIFQKISWTKTKGSKYSLWSWICFLVLRPCLECGRKITKEEAAFLTLRMRFLFSFLTDALSRSDKKLKRLEWFHGLVQSCFDSLGDFSSERRRSFSLKVHIFFEKSLFFFLPEIVPHYSCKLTEE